MDRQQQWERAVWVNLPQMLDELRQEGWQGYELHETMERPTVICAAKVRLIGGEYDQVTVADALVEITGPCLVIGYSEPESE